MIKYSQREFTFTILFKRNKKINFFFSFIFISNTHSHDMKSDLFFSFSPLSLSRHRSVNLFFKRFLFHSKSPMFEKRICFLSLSLSLARISAERNVRHNCVDFTWQSHPPIYDNYLSVKCSIHCVCCLIFFFSLLSHSFDGHTIQYYLLPKKIYSCKCANRVVCTNILFFQQLYFSLKFFFFSHIGTSLPNRSPTNLNAVFFFESLRHSVNF